MCGRGYTPAASCNQLDQGTVGDKPRPYDAMAFHKEGTVKLEMEKSP